MVARLTLGRKKYEAVAADMQRVLEDGDRLRAELTACVEEDSAAFEEVMAAFKLPKGADEQNAAREAAVQRAYHHAADVPLRVCRAAVKVLELSSIAAAKGNANALSDSGSSGFLAHACFKGAAQNVRANAKEVTDTAQANAWLAEVAQLESRAAELLARVERVVAERK
jgi:glutamate formiminotransferase/formiminotetrahydrofolate cyclodeaminase